ncbi:MAG: YdiY family protein [Sphingomonas sp.]
MRALLFALPLLLANAPGDPDTIPPPIKAMLDAAMASGNEGDVAVVVKYAKTAAPESAPQIVKIADDWRAERRRKREQSIREAGLFDLVKGRAELGAYVTQGNSNNIGITAVVEIKREALQWRHKLRFQGDYQESVGVVTRERFLAAYEPNWKFGERAYMYGAAQFETDRILGYAGRISVSTGAGYSAFKRPGLRLDVELGPAYRHTIFTDRHVESNPGVRGSVDFEWKPVTGITLRQNASAYVQDANSTVTSKSALLARLIGPLSAQLSYTLQYESEPPAGRVQTDTVSRAALVVDF